MTGKRIAWFALCGIIVLAVSGCTGSLNSSDSGAANEFAAQPLGVGVCSTAGCHDTQVGDWNPSDHANLNAFPPTDFFGAPNCDVCHDINGERFILGRNVVGCEACHGGGERHAMGGTTGPLFNPPPYPRPDYDRCGQCHNQNFNTAAHMAPEGGDIVEDYKVSPHILSVNSHVMANANEVHARCSKCHTDQGARDYRNVSGGYNTLIAALPYDGTAATPDIFPVEPVQCRTCHFGHNPGDLLLGLNENVTGSSEFNTCTTCHQLTDAAGNKVSAYHDPAVNTRGDDGEIITDTHFATSGSWPDPSAFTENEKAITGYAMDFADSRVCRNCHNPHNADVTISRQWALSAHADTSAGGAWAHFNWSAIAGGSCKRCHTVSGVVEYIAANADGDDSDYNGFLGQPASDANYKPERLHCNGCHSDSLGGLRTTAAIPTGYTDAPAFTFPDVSGSNICLACHKGRQSGQSIENNSATAFTNTGFIEPHGLPAGGTLFNIVGYEYVGASYADKPWFAHNDIGVGTTTGIGTEGPCIGCHLSSSENHLLLPLAVDGSGIISAITSTACGQCHAGPFALTASGLQEEKEGFENALTALEASLTASGFTFLGGFPYFTETDWTTPGDATGKATMGAAFNLVLLNGEPGAWVHNSYYARRLIFDSVDWLDDNLLNGSVDLSLFPEAAAYLDGDPGTAGVQRP